VAELHVRERRAAGRERQGAQPCAHSLAARDLGAWTGALASSEAGQASLLVLESLLPRFWMTSCVVIRVSATECGEPVDDPEYQGYRERPGE